jgi:hypothetical protein
VEGGTRLSRFRRGGGLEERKYYNIFKIAYVDRLKQGLTVLSSFHVISGNNRSFIGLCFIIIICLVVSMNVCVCVCVCERAPWRLSNVS